MQNESRPIEWIASSRDDLAEFPKPVRTTVGGALHAAQEGRKADAAKTLTGFGGASVLEVVADHDGSTFRAVYTVRFEKAVYVLHCFQKKSTSGIATSKQDLDLVRTRLKKAEEDYARKYGAK